MKALNKNSKKVIMWYKVQELHTEGLNKSQISRETGIHRKTVRAYLSMTESEFHTWIASTRCLPKKLNIYYEYVRELLKSHPYLSAAQVEDRLKERFNDMPLVHSKTVYNFVQNIRKCHGITKRQSHQPRQYEKLPELAYGLQAQADFGEYYMQTHEGGRKKVHFFVMVLSRSRQKYVYFQSIPFTASTAIKAHTEAFNYFGGQPKEVVYDQDRVFIVKENLGDVLLTKEFSIYCQQMSFKTVFCRKSDPESKGKIENVVGYVKNNFLRGREYINESTLNQSAQAWLARTANSKEHAGTKKIPMQEWEKEREYLIPLKASPEPSPDESMKKYKVRKDNTINYKSNFYTLPLGTYQGVNTWVLLKESEGQLQIYTETDEPLTIHPISHQRGMTISNTDHRRDKSQSYVQLKETVLGMMPGKEKSGLFLEMINKEKPRYFRDNLLVLMRHLPEYNTNSIAQAIDFCLENNIYNANTFIEITKHYKQELEQQNRISIIIPKIELKHDWDALNSLPQQSKISTYEPIL